MSLDHLWAGWRMAYIAGAAPTPVPPGDGSIFERILTADVPDEETFVVWRGATCAALLNIYPYTSGHLMVMPTRAVAGLGDLTEAESAELWSGVRMGVSAVEAAYEPEGVNIGANLGAAAGAGVPGHLHVHVLPRWHGDTNFMTTVASARVMPEELGATWSRLRAAWPDARRAQPASG